MLDWGLSILVFWGCNLANMVGHALCQTVLGFVLDWGLVCVCVSWLI